MWFAVHATHTLDPQLQEIVDRVKQAGSALPSKLPSGAIVGAIIVQRSLVSRHPDVVSNPWCSDGNYCWVVADRISLPTPVPFQGKAGIWQVTDSQVGEMLTMAVKSPRISPPVSITRGETGDSDDDETRGGVGQRAYYEGSVLGDSDVDLQMTEQRICTTLRQWIAHEKKAHYKQRHTTFRNWNMLSLGQLKELHACVRLLLDRGCGVLVPLQDLLRAAREANTNTISRNVRCDSKNGGCGDFRKWLTKQLCPAATCYVQLIGAEGHATKRVFFYGTPLNRQAIDLLRDSQRQHESALNAISDKASLRKTNVPAYLALIPEQATQRVIRGMLLEISGSTSFLKSAFGIGPVASKTAESRVAAAFAVTASVFALDVPNNLTTAGAARKQKSTIQDAIQDALANEHAGGTASLDEYASDLGVDLVDVIESSCAVLSTHNYGEVRGYSVRMVDCAYYSLCHSALSSRTISVALTY